MRRGTSLRFAFAPAFGVLVLQGCSGSDTSSTPPGTGGANSSGGAADMGGNSAVSATTGGKTSSVGGQTAESGGNSSSSTNLGGSSTTGTTGGATTLGTGGSVAATGGASVIGTGGAPVAVGGASATGGKSSSGGTTVTVGGASTTGGKSAVGGGSTATGGAANTGGSATATGGALSTGGSTSVGNTCGDNGDPTIPSVSGTLIDFDMSGRNATEVLEPGWNEWIAASATTDSMTFNGVTFKLTVSGSTGTLAPTWYKAGVDAPNYARLVGDGVTVTGATPGAIQVTLTGLSAGAHTLLAYHNGVDGNVYRPVNVDVNGTRQVTNLQPTNRSLTTDASASSYVTFTAAVGQTVNIVYSPSTSGSGTQSVVINALALDVPNTALQAAGATPEDRDWHVNADSGNFTLSWTAAKSATAHNVYFGTDGTAVFNATTASSVFKGKQTGTTYAVTGLSNLKHYYWRIDEIDSAGTVTKGNLWSFSPRHLAFPGAEGYGRFARGGRCGKVVYVTNLNDSGTGSLRAAIETDIGPRTVVFDVAGLIVLGSRLTLANDNVTVAGQTAPGKGITIRTAPFGMSGGIDDVIQHVRVRLGGGQTYDGMGMAGSDNSIVDHCSISWTIDEGFSSRNAKNITLQRTMISECLNVAGHQNYPAGTAHGYAGSISGDIGSFHHNLLAHCEGRNWSLAGGLDGDGNFAGRLDIFSTVIYNWDGRTTDGGAHEVNFVNNYYKPGAASSIFTALNAQYDSFPGTQQYYMAGNVMPGYFDETNQAKGRTVTNSPTAYSPWVSSAFFPSYATVQSAGEAYKDVLSDVGMSEPVFDDHDTRIVKETLNGTYTYKGSVSGIPGLPDNEADVGGYESYPTTTRASSWDGDGDGLPDFWETAKGLSNSSASGNFADSNADPDGDGFTNLEDYLAWMSLPHYFSTKGTAVSIDLKKLFAGYTSSPVYTSSAAVGGTVSISSSTASYTPNACGFGSVTLSVKDSADSTKSRSVVFFSTGC